MDLNQKILRVIELKHNFTEIYCKLLRSEKADSDEILLYKDGIKLCDKFLSGTINIKHFIDHLYLINFGLESFILMDIIRKYKLVLEE